MNEFLFSTYINFIIVFINYNFFLFVKMVMISNWNGTEKQIFVLIMAASNCAMSTRRLKSVYKTIPSREDSLHSHLVNLK